MNSRRFLLLALAGVAPLFGADPKSSSTTPNAAPTTGATPARAGSSIAPSLSFDAFRPIGDRNIFNPNRTGRRERTTGDQAPRVDTISLVGTMDSDRGLFAFFEGSDASYRRAVQAGGAVEQFKVTKITPDNVDLDRNGSTYSVKVGQQFRRAEGADWTLAAADLGGREGAPVRATDNAATAIPADASDTLKRLMEQRQKQLKQ
jgi:hypothetical protein